MTAACRHRGWPPIRSPSAAPFGPIHVETLVHELVHGGVIGRRSDSFVQIGLGLGHGLGLGDHQLAGSCTKPRGHVYLTTDGCTLYFEEQAPRRKWWL